MRRRERLDRALAHRLGERVVVGPAERLRSSAPVLHEPLGHPRLAALLGVVGHRLRAGASVLGAGLAQERVEDLGLAARGLDVGPRPDRQVGLGLPVRRGGRASPRGSRPCGRPATYAVETWSRCGAGLFASAASYRRTAPTRLVRNPSSIGGSNATVAAQWITTSRPPGISSPSAEKSPSTTSTRSSQRGRDPLGADLVAQGVERGPAHQRLDALAPARAELRPHEQGDPGVGEVEQEAFEHRLAEEARHPRDEHVLAGQLAHDRARARACARALPRGRGFVYHMADYALSTEW